MVRYNPDGALDNSFWSSSGLYGNDGKVFVDFNGSPDSVFGLALDSAGRAVIVGAGDSLFGVVRLQGDNTVPGIIAPFVYDGNGKTDAAFF